MISAKQLIEESTMKADGYCRLQGIYDAEFLTQLRDQAQELVTRTYNQSELEKHSVYPSDASDSRVSHAVMIAEGKSARPCVEHDDLPAVNQFLHDYNSLLAEITGKPVATDARCMLNFQNYFSGSKPVAEHFDGEYLRTERAEDGLEFELVEGILPRYVAVLVVENDNDGKGTELVDGYRNKVFAPELNPGDLLIFDNIKLRHRVPTMENPRITIGIRSFDHLPLHFARSRDEYIEGKYRPIAEGWVSEDADCLARFDEFMKVEWPTLKEDYSHYF